jgi:hypothetical protein
LLGILGGVQLEGTEPISANPSHMTLS